MKILIAITKIPPYCGGAEQVAWETAVRLAKYKDVEVHVICIGNNKDEYKNNIKVHYLPSKPLLTIYYSTKGFHLIKKLLIKEKFDLIQIHMLLPWAYLFRNIKCKKVLTCHGDEVYKTKIYQYYFTKIGLHCVNKITCPSKWLTNFIINQWHVPAIFIINGVDTKLYHPIKSKNKKDYILYYGRYTKRKGLLEFLDVIKELPQYRFIFIGSGKLNPLIKGNNIQNLGPKFNNELIKYIQEAKIIVAPSHWENMPIVGLESLACGKAVIATEMGFNEIIENGKEGIIIPPKNKVALKESIIKLMSNEKLITLFENNARKRALNYDWDKIVKQYYELYREVLYK